MTNFMNEHGLKIMLTLSLIALFSFSIFLWLQTPLLFEYFNQAFCAH